MRFRFSFLVFFLLTVFIFDLGFFAASLLPAPRNPESVETVDVIAALTGGKHRLKEALNFFMQGRGKYLIVSGVAPESKLDDILKANKIESLSPELRRHIYLDYESGSTLENAGEVRQIIDRFEAHSVLLVTSTYHMQRALRLLRRELRKSPTAQVNIYEFPVESPNFDRDRWWWSPTAWSILLWEYFKSMPFRLGF